MILVTGASGLLGASLVSLAQAQGREVVGLYHRHPVHIEGVKLLAADLSDRPKYAESSRNLSLRLSYTARPQPT